jgi:hypothetical protein
LPTFGFKISLREEKQVILKLCVLGSFALAANALERPLQGLIDIHVHSDPDNMTRKIDAPEAARLMRDEGMRAIVLKSITRLPPN